MICAKIGMPNIIVEYAMLQELQKELSHLVVPIQAESFTPIWPTVMLHLEMKRARVKPPICPQIPGD